MITKEEVFEGEYSQFDVIQLLERIAELEKEREWISVESAMPETTGMVLATDGDTVLNFAYIKYADGGGKWGRGGDVITHWMPLPKPPKEQGE